jgi:hypothetical protein
MTWRERIAGVGAFFRSHGWLFLIALVVLLFAVAVIRPFETVRDPTGDDVAAAWNQSIGKLGIIPVYPPAEDVSVGDVWAIVANSDQIPLLGKAVRLDHINLRKQILEADQQPTFAETVEPGTGATYAKQDRYEAAPDPAKATLIQLNLTAFPGITINHAINAGTAAGTGASGWFGAGRQQSQHAEIRLKGTETYGMSPIDAIYILNSWCKDEKTKMLCSDDKVRTILSFTVGDMVLKTKNNSYTSTIILQLVTRVFLAREIEQKRVDDSGKGAGVQVGADPAQAASSQNPSAAPASDSTDAQRVAALAEGVTKTLAAGTAMGAKLSVVRSDGLDLSLQETFQRPVVFGYRAVTIRLPPSKPAEEPVP